VDEHVKRRLNIVSRLITEARDLARYERHTGPGTAAGRRAQTSRVALSIRLDESAESLEDLVMMYAQVGDPRR
jgi:hypothetical protein